jgi:glycosyltransferase involved in cell wall biosynthesis
MRITFVVPAPNLSGGALVIGIYAEMLQRRGHSVTVFVAERGLPLFRQVASTGPSHYDGRGLNVVSGRVSDSRVPDGDVVIATFWNTAHPVSRLARRKGTKFYFIQHHEVFDYLPQRKARETYRLPLGKIVISQWLADVMRKDYGSSAVVVPNSVEHARFFADPRSKQSSPTVGLLYSSAPWKAFDVALAALLRVKAVIPNLQAICFGIEHPPSLPDFASFSFRPAQDSIRHLYTACDVWLTASRTEGFNLPAMEAMACRTPVVATRTGWPAEAVVDGWNGAIVDVDDVQGLADQVCRILQADAAEWRRMSDNAYETVRYLSWEDSADRFEEALRQGSLVLGDAWRQPAPLSV